MKCNFLLSLSLLLLFSLFGRPHGRAEEEPWLPASGPFGGSVAALALSPNYAVDHTVFAGLRGRGVYRTINGGNSWHSASPADWTVIDLAISLAFADDQTLFVASGLWAAGYSIYRSTDEGDSWQDVTPAWSSLPDPPRLAISPDFETDGTIYVLGGSQTYLSTDGGDTFVQASGWFTSQNVVELAFSPAYATDQTLFALVPDDGLYKSGDGGTTWTPTSLSGDYSTFAVSPDYANDQMLIAVAAEDGQLYVSTDGGDTWSPGSLGLDATGQHTLLFSPTFAGDRIILAASSTDPGAYRSEDGGATWSPVGWYDPAHPYQGGFIGGTVFALALAPSDALDAAAFAGTSSGVYRSVNRGISWSQRNNGLARLTVRALAVAPGDPNTLLAGTSFFEHLRFDTSAPGEYDGNLQLSTDGGQTWRDVSGRLDRVYDVVFSPGFATDRIAFAATGALGQHGYYGGGVYRSTDGGQNWSEVLSGQICEALALHPNFPMTQTLWASTSTYTTALGIYESTDGGDTWTPLATTVHAQIFVPSPNYAVDQTFFAGTHDGGLQRSTDGGQNWTHVLTYSVTALAVSPAYGASRTLYAGVKASPTDPGEVYRSTDGGDTWQRLDTGIPATWEGNPVTISTLAFAYDGSVLAGVYYGSESGGGAVYRSDDSGVTWQVVGGGLGTGNAFVLATVPSRSLTFYVGTDAGLWQLYVPQGGPAEPGIWESSGPRGGRVRALAVSPGFANDGLAFAGGWVQERGAGQSGLGIFKSTDEAQTWESASGGTRDVTYSSAIHAFAFSPGFATDQIIFAATWGGLFRSTDGGGNWSWVNRLYSGPPGSITAVALAPNYPVSGHVLAASGWGGLYLSRDGGINWTAYYTVPASSAVAYSPDFASDGMAFAGGWDSLYRTSDGGVSWTQVLTTGVSVLAVSPQFGIDTTLFVGGDALYTSQDGGTSWVSVTLPLAPRIINALAVSPGFATDQMLFAGVNEGLYQSSDGGLSWQSVAGYPGLSVRSLAISPDWPAHPILLAGTDQGVYRTADGGTTWSLTQGLTALATEPLALSVDENLLLTGAYRHGIYGSTNGGGSWFPLGLQQMGYHNVTGVAISPAYATDQTVFAALVSTISIGAGVYRTTDGGTTWELVYSTDYLGAMAISPQYASDLTVYTAGAGGRVLVSDDGGENWSSVGEWPSSASYPARLIALPPNYPSDSTLFAGGGEGFWRLLPGATAWELAASGLLTDTYVSSIAVSPNYAGDETLLATASWQEELGGEGYHGVLRSTDAGANWDLVSIGLPNAVMRYVAFSPNYVFDHTAYVTSEEQLYRSLDGGLSWTAVGTPLGAFTPYALVVDSHGDVYVTSDSSVWHYHTAAQDIIVNGGFEARSGWELPQTSWPAGYSDRVAYEGMYSIRIGIDNGEDTYSYSSARQVITIPTDAISATLSCYIYPVSGEAVQVAQDQAFPQGMVTDHPFKSGKTAGDAQYLLLLDPDSGAIVETFLWELSNAQSWQFHVFDLISYAGQSLKLHFGVRNDGVGGQTGIYVDNVSLIVKRPLPVGVASQQYLPLILGGHTGSTRSARP